MKGDDDMYIYTKMGETFKKVKGFDELPSRGTPSD